MNPRGPVSGPLAAWPKLGLLWGAILPSLLGAPRQTPPPPPAWLRVFKTNGNQGAENLSSNKNVSTRVPKKGENRQKVETRVHLRTHGQNGTYCAVGRDSAAERNEAGAWAATRTGPDTEAQSAGLHHERQGEQAGWGDAEGSEGWDFSFGGRKHSGDKPPCHQTLHLKMVKNDKF